MQDEVVSDSTQVDEAVTFDEVPEESEDEAPPAEASFTQELKRDLLREAQDLWNCFDLFNSRSSYSD